ncbi:MAG: hypothetical protein COB04_00235 [Gammaproteobacteria bacterium]|nr:MAG: hypothetical protein COB04_00235 [Gammaproteobacteria bacterium]
MALTTVTRDISAKALTGIFTMKTNNFALKQRLNNLFSKSSNHARHFIFGLIIINLGLSQPSWAEETSSKKRTVNQEQSFSIIGNKESPTILNIVPWKSPQNPNMINIDIPAIDELKPVFRKSLRREIHYFYQRQPVTE